MKSFYRVKLKEKKKTKKGQPSIVLFPIWTSHILFHQIYHASHTNNTWNLILIWCVDIHFWRGKALSPPSNICLEERAVLLIPHTQGEGIEQGYGYQEGHLRSCPAPWVSSVLIPTFCGLSRGCHLWKAHPGHTRRKNKTRSESI